MHCTGCEKQAICECRVYDHSPVYKNKESDQHILQYLYMFLSDFYISSSMSL